MLSRAINFKKFSIINQLIGIRSYRTRKRENNLPENPGLDKRLKHFKDDIMEYSHDPEEFDSMEPDFMNLNLTHRQHERQLIKMKDKNYQLMIGRKYFKSKSPNFLTFNEKEQIRDLHAREPHEWTIDKLSESFPADPLTISLILRAKWQPKDLKRIAKHDESVIRNWNEFKEGKLQVDPLLAEHLKKFSFRDMNELTEQKANRKLGVKTPMPKKTEFLSIVTSCKKIKNSDKLETEKIKEITSRESKFPIDSPHADSDTFLLDEKSNDSNRNITLHELQKNNPHLKLDNDTVDNKSTVLAKCDEKPQMKVSKIEDKEKDMTTLLVKDTDQILDSLEIQEKIKIPKKLHKKGKIYQVEDCFYADDGEFLYRVPGFFR